MAALGAVVCPLLFITSQTALAAAGASPHITSARAVDFNKDSAVDSADVGLLLGAFGPCMSQLALCPHDLDGDGSVDAADLELLLPLLGILWTDDCAASDPSSVCFFCPHLCGRRVPPGRGGLGDGDPDTDEGVSNPGGGGPPVGGPTPPLDDDEPPPDCPCDTALIDVDIDSDNTNGDGPPDLTLEEDLAENVTGDDGRPGKLILVSSWDTDGDAVEDFADGFDWSPLIAQDDSSPDARLIPVAIQTAGAQPGALVRIEYSHSDPAELTLGDDGWAHAEGRLRLWRRNGVHPRVNRSVFDGGDFVPSGVYRLADLAGAGGSSFYLFAEAVAPCSGVAQGRITVRLDPTGSSGWVCCDTVRYTSVEVGIEGRGYGEPEWRPIGALMATNLHPPAEPPPPGHTAGAWMLHRFVVKDPRGALAGELFTLGADDFELSGSPGLYTTEPFHLLWGAPPSWTGDLQGRAIVSPSDGPELDWGYDPLEEGAGLRGDDAQSKVKGRAKKVRVNPISEADHVIKPLLAEVIAEMEAENWAGNPNDSGAFGKEVHRRVFERMGPRPRWFASVWLKENTREIISIGSPAGVGEAIEIDAFYAKPGYTPVVGQVFDPAQVDDVYEIKTSLQGRVEESKRGFYDSMFGSSKWKMSAPEKYWSHTAGWINHPRGGLHKYFKIVGMAGAATTIAGVSYSLYAICHPADHEDQLIRVTQAYELATRRDSQNPLRQMRVMDFLDEARLYLARFTTDEVVANGFFLTMFYTYLATK